MPYLDPGHRAGAGGGVALFVGMLGVRAALLLGYRTELAARVLSPLFLYHYFLQLAVKESVFERLIAIDLLVLCFADFGPRVGIRRAPRRPRRRTVWAERVLAAQTVFLYSGSGLWKVFNPAWHSGALLRSTLQSMWATRLGVRARSARILRASGPFSWTIIGSNWRSARCCCSARTRPLALVLGTVFHLVQLLRAGDSGVPRRDGDVSAVHRAEHARALGHGRSRV